MQEWSRSSGRPPRGLVRAVVRQALGDRCLMGSWQSKRLFTEKYLTNVDAVLAMYHDQGLPVLKHSGFGRAANITLGLPIIRTSVDHGTAINLAGTNQVNSGSFEYVID